ncbi:MAG TPA: hypothetical protein VJI33_00325 [Candidatus Paceibacterota bacterium]
MDIVDTERGDQIVALDTISIKVEHRGSEIKAEIVNGQILAVDSVLGDKPTIVISASYLAKEAGHELVFVTIGCEELGHFDRLRARNAIHT